MRKIFTLLAIFLTALCTPSFATHNRAGEITFTRLSDYTYKATIVTYTKSDSPADRCRISINWGDGSEDTLTRINGLQSTDCPHIGEDIAPLIKKNLYEGVHTYRGGGIYKIWMSDPNRNQGIINIPGSVNIPFYIETQLTISPFVGVNNSPVLLNPPIDNACIGRIFIHNPGAYDPDTGDSLAYELTACRGENGAIIPGFTLPAGVSLNPVTGDFIWNSPTQIGEFNFALLIKEYRNKKLIGYVTRDMQVTVKACENEPPQVFARDTCVTAGTLLQFNVNGVDPNFDNVTLTSTGGPYLVTSSPASFLEPPFPGPAVTGQFHWQTECSHVKRQPYTVTFKAEDDNNEWVLADLKTINITVVSPAPQNLTATPIGSTIKLDWVPTICSNAVGYKIFRRNGSTGYVAPVCETGIPASLGYSLIKTLEGSASTTFTDDNNGSGLTPGMEYCYMIYAYFSDGAESYPSNEACTELKKDVPVITHVSVVETAASTGKDTIIWSKPTEIDPSISGPFHYVIYHSNDMAGSNFSALDTLSSLNDTIYYHQAGINTQNQANSYKISLYTETPSWTLIGSTVSASSVFLQITPSDNALTLSWDYNVPWNNYKFYIFKKDQAGVFNLLDSTTSRSYTETGLINGHEYCYYITSYGEYSGDGFLKPLVNKSQIACESPKDMTAPCAPVLAITPDCDFVKNYLSWNNPNNGCADDVVSYKIYYKTTNDTNQTYNLLTTIGSATDTTYTFNGINSIAGCYVITAIDSFGNESVQSANVCVDNCPVYELPNVFTPNGDNINDLFRALPYKFVEDIDIKIFNRWGHLMFETTNPDVLWDGKNSDTKMTVSDGVYYYICQVNEIRLEGIVPHFLKGFVHVYNVKAPQNP